MTWTRPILASLAVAACLGSHALSAPSVNGGLVGTWRCAQTNGYGPIYYAFGPDGRGASHIPAEKTVRLAFTTQGDRLDIWPADNARVVSHLTYAVSGDALTERSSYSRLSTVCGRVSPNWMMPDAQAGIPDFSVDNFIDAGVPASQRAYVRAAMLALSPDEREYVWGWDRDGKFFSNRLPDYRAMQMATDGFFTGRRQAPDPAIVGSWRCGDTRIRYRSDGTGMKVGPQGTWSFVFATHASEVMQHDVTSVLGTYSASLERYRFLPREATMSFDRYLYWREGDGWTTPSSAVEMVCRRT